MLDNKSNLARLALVSAYQRGELSFVQMAKKTARLGKKKVAKKVTDDKKLVRNK